MRKDRERQITRSEKQTNYKEINQQQNFMDVLFFRTKFVCFGIRMCSCSSPHSVSKRCSRIRISSFNWFQYLQFELYQFMLHAKFLDGKYFPKKQWGSEDLVLFTVSESNLQPSGLGFFSWAGSWETNFGSSLLSPRKNKALAGGFFHSFFFTEKIFLAFLNIQVFVFDYATLLNTNLLMTLMTASSCVCLFSSWSIRPRRFSSILFFRASRWPSFLHRLYINLKMWNKAFLVDTSWPEWLRHLVKND